MTTEQLALHMPELIEPAYDTEATIAERFAAFHGLNPWVADALETLAADWLAHGHKRFGVKALVEIIRWSYGRQTTGDQGFALNNSLTSHYARLLIDRHPEWVEAISLRELRAA